MKILTIFYCQLKKLHYLCTEINLLLFTKKEMIMKKMMMIAAMMIAAVSVNAQNEVGQITLQPKVGINISKITGEGIKMTAGLAAGVEAEYGVAENFGLTAGVLYSMQGYKYEDADKRNAMDYINIPILAQYYVVKGLAIKAGVQPGFLVRAKYDGESFSDYCKKFDFSIPVGLSYEYQNFVLDARYNIGLTKTMKDASEKTKNSVIQITLGYKFAL